MKLDKFVQKRREIAEKYDESFSKIDFLKISNNDSSVNHAYHLYPLQIDFEKIGISKRQVFKEMKQVGINLQVHYIPVHLQPYYKKNYGFSLGDYPIAEEFYTKEVSLPIYPDLSTEDVSFVINNILEIISA